jgi:exosortase
MSEVDSTPAPSEPSPVQRTRGDEIALWIGLAAVFAPGVGALAERWASAEYYQHGFLVPLVSALTAHPRLRALGPSERHAPALLGLALALALYGLGVAAAEVTLQGLALVAAIAALVGFRWGMRGIRRLAFPLGFLLFMVPLPEVWVYPVVTRLQTFASACAVAVLNALDVPVMRDGNVMRLPNGASLFVAEACSGITSLLSLIPVAVLLARFTQRGMWQRVALVASVIPAALFGNMVRVIATVIAAHTWGAQRATSGPIHESAGLLTSAFAVLLVVAFGAALTRATRVPARGASA